jgi:RNA polymerase-interacting CarD/CdnL/TRCF family regulator
VGTIKNIEEKEILGSKAIFVTMYFDRDDLKLTVGQKNLDSKIREVLDEEEAREVLDYLASCGAKLSKNWRARNKNNQERLTSGDPKALCDLIKGLIQLKRSKGGELSNSDRAQLNRAVEILAEELFFSLERDSVTNLMEEIRHTCRATLAA